MSVRVDEATRRRARAAVAAALLGVAGAAAPLGCSDPPPEFGVRAVTPEPRVGLRLNEPLSLVFSADVDPSSVSADSVVVSSGGARVAGRLSTQGARVTFEPSPFTRADLGDGGYPPGAEVDVRIAAFPARTGVRAADGRPLARPFHGVFATRRLGDRPGPDGPFVDASPGRGPELVDGPEWVGGWVRLGLSEPIWPGSLDAVAVQLRFDDPDRTAVPVEVRLGQGADRADLFLRPRDGFAPGTGYILHVGGGLCDLAGNEMVGVTKPFQVDPDLRAPDPGAGPTDGASGAGGRR